MSLVNKTFSDLNLDFVPHPASGDIIPLKNVEAIKRSIRNLVFTNVYERPFQPKLGSGLRQLLFEPVTPVIQNLIREHVKDLLRVHEKRATVVEVEVTVNPDENGYEANIIFSVNNFSVIESVDVFLKRVR